MTNQRPKTKAEQREATKRRLIEVGRGVFASTGYTAAASEEIVQLAGVTRGALYHHFDGKEGLFRAVLEEVQAEVAARITQASEAAADLWGQLVAGCHAFLEASLDPAVQRIMLLDAPAVLGWEIWRQIDAAQSGRLLAEVLDMLAAERQIHPLPLEALTRLLSGAMNEAALWIARSDDPQRALEEAKTALDALLRSLRTV